MSGRYIVLAGDCYYPAGWGDFRGSFDSLDEARATAKAAALSPHTANRRDDAWWQIIDKTTDKVVERSW